LGRYEVTQRQWEAVVGTNPSRFRGPNNPVDNVSWDDCQDFLKKLNEKAATRGGEFRLPTEAEWEYACRAGSQTKWCFGDDPSRLKEYAWYLDNVHGAVGGTTQPVGRKKANAWGLYDMHGNVREWCADWYDEKYYGSSPQEHPRGPSERSYRVGRGGSWCNNAGFCRSARRGGRGPSVRTHDLGFRLAR
jgi:formylglycine-generating enzyme required for sulfatase activity